MKKNILISLIATLGISFSGIAQEDLQGQLSGKEPQSMEMLSLGSTEQGTLEESKEGSTYNYDQEYEDLLKSIHSLDSTSDYNLDTTLLDTNLAHHEDDYDQLLKKASTILGQEKVATLTKQVEDTIFEKDGKNGTIELTGHVDRAANSTKKKKVHSIHLKNTSDIIHESFALISNDLDLNIKNDTNRDDTEALYQNLLDGLSDGRGSEVTQLFNLASEEELVSEEFQYQLNDGYPMEEITTVGLLKGTKKHFKKCLIMKTYGGGTWRTYCQPIAKPTQCTDQEWRDLSTMPIMFC